MKRGYRNIKYRTRILITFLLSVAIVAITGFYTNLSSTSMMEDTSELFNKTIELTSAYRKLADIQSNVEDYLATNSSESLLAYYDNVNQLTPYVANLRRNITYASGGIKIKNFANMIDHYLKQADETINARRGRNINGYTTGYEQTVKESAMIISYVKEMMSSDLINGAEHYVAINQRNQRMVLFNYIYIGITVIMVVLIIITFSFEITKPITQLALHAEEISKGNFEVQIPPSKVSGEIDVLYNAFHAMALYIKEYVNQLKKNQQLENSLHEQRLNNLKMKNALHESELRALQAQVNPHFIFNTINIGAKTAMLQGDWLTCTYLENAADIFRYNLRGLDEKATLGDEIRNVQAYMYLLTIRFGEAVRFHMEVEDDPAIRQFVLPRMTLQPIVENAYIHGIGPLEEGGTITLRISRDERSVFIAVLDTGAGIPEETIAEILSRSDGSAGLSKSGHTTRIGIGNVMKRLQLFFGTEAVMRFDRIGRETQVLFILPWNKEGAAVNV